MKIKILVFLILVFFLSIKCENKARELTACGIPDPLNKISWLKDLKNELQNETKIESAEIVLYKKNNSDYLYVGQKIASSYDFPVGRLYNCEGILKYSCGGNQPIDSCSIFLLSAQKTSILWKK